MLLDHIYLLFKNLLLRECVRPEEIAKLQLPTRDGVSHWLFRENKYMGKSSDSPGLEHFMRYYWDSNVKVQNSICSLAAWGCVGLP